MRWCLFALRCPWHIRFREFPSFEVTYHIYFQEFLVTGSSFEVCSDEHCFGICSFWVRYLTLYSNSGSTLARKTRKSSCNSVLLIHSYLHFLLFCSFCCLFFVLTIYKPVTWFSYADIHIGNLDKFQTNGKRIYQFDIQNGFLGCLKRLI